MSTPAANVLSGSGAGGAAAGAGGGAPAGAGGAGGAGAGAGGGAPAAGGGGAANSSQFWSGWAAPEQKETRDWIANKNYADPFTLAKSAHQFERDAAALRASKGYPVDKPGADGKVVRDENAWRAWNTAVGVPESPDKYEIPVPDNNPYPQFKQYMAEAFHQAGVPAAMATQLAKGYESAVGRMETQIREQENTASQQALAELEHSWGAQYQERIALAQRGQAWLSKEVGGLNEIQMRTLESVLGTAKFMSAMWKIGAGNTEGRFAGGDGGGTRFAGGASEAQARWDQIMADRAAGKINDHQWRGMRGELDQLQSQIVGGMAPPQ